MRPIPRLTRTVAGRSTTRSSVTPRPRASGSTSRSPGPGRRGPRRRWNPPAAGRRWKPSASAFGEFVHAVATRYSGHYRPAGSPAALPRVDFWAIWNEPNYGIDLAPQAIDHSTIETLRRSTADCWGPPGVPCNRRATVPTRSSSESWRPEASPREQPRELQRDGPVALPEGAVLREFLLSVLAGGGCRGPPVPHHRAASAAFKAENPALFNATGVPVHPYPQGGPPTQTDPGSPTMPIWPRSLASSGPSTASSRTTDPQRVRHLRHRIRLPDKSAREDPAGISPTLASYYLNWSEYLHWRDPRIRSYDQYLLTDPPRSASTRGSRPQAGCPWRPTTPSGCRCTCLVTSASSGAKLEIWGCARPAHYAQLQTGQPQDVRSSSRHRVRVLQDDQTVQLSNPHGYFDVLQKLTSAAISGPAGAIRTGPRCTAARWR